MEINPIGETTGAEVIGVDLRQPLDAETQKTLNDALMKYVAVVFRDQELEPKDICKAVENFGEPMRGQYAAEYAVDEEPMVTVVSNQHRKPDGKRVYHGRTWHSDQTHRKYPPNYTVLYGVTVPKEGGDTGILNTRDGYESLPDEMKAQLDTMIMHNLITSGRARLAESTKDFVLSEDDLAKEARSHPLIREHPENGSKALYFHAIKIDHIEGMTPEETKELMQDILNRIETPKFLYRHKWRKNDLLIWDNRSAVHKAFFDYDLSQERILQRTILRGTTPYGPAVPREVVEAAAAAE